MYLWRLRKWCERENSENMNNISGRDLHDFRQSRADDLAHFFSTVDWEFDLEDIFQHRGLLSIAG